MAWTNRPDSAPCCVSALGRVEDSEAVARLLHSKNAFPENAGLQRKELIPPIDRAPSNICGQSDGASVIRRDSISDDGLREKSAVQAAKRPGRTPEGARCAIVRELRQIRLKQHGQTQLVFAYDDPKDGDEAHAVIRVADCVGDEELNEVRDLIWEAFRMKIHQ